MITGEDWGKASPVNQKQCLYSVCQSPALLPWTMALEVLLLVLATVLAQQDHIIFK